MTIKDSEIFNNYALKSGLIHGQEYYSVSLENSLFENNYCKDPVYDEDGTTLLSLNPCWSTIHLGEGNSISITESTFKGNNTLDEE